MASSTPPPELLAEQGASQGTGQGQTPVKTSLNPELTTQFLSMPPPRKKTSPIEDLFEVLKELPVWAGPIVAGGLYLLMAVVIPSVFLSAGNSGNPISQQFGKTLSGLAHQLAPVVGLGTLALWIGSLVVRAVDGERLERQTGVESIRTLSWSAFEKLLAEAFRRRGFAVEETPPGPDGGVDLVLRRDGDRVLVQAKQWRTQRVGVKVVRELAGVLAAEKADGAIVATSGSFTREAEEFAARSGVRLIGGKKLEAMVREVQRRPSGRSSMTDPPPGAAVVASTAPPQRPSNADEPTPSCPSCGAVMVMRRAKRGPNAGSQFWGCSEYGSNRCKGTRNLT